MKILLISPPINQMNTIRSQNIAKAMKSLGYEVTLISYAQSKRDIDDLENDKSLVDYVKWIKIPKFKSYLNCVAGLPSVKPLRVHYCNSKKLADLIQETVLTESFDFAYIIKLQLSDYAEITKKAGIKTLIDLTDSTTRYYESIINNEQGIKKLIAKEELLKLKMYEPNLCLKNNPVILCSEQDKQYLVSLNFKIKNNIYVMNNTIDVNEWINIKPRISPKGNRKKLTFFGMMDFSPNITAVNFLIDKVMPLLPDDYSIEFIGANVSRKLKEKETNRIHFSGRVDNIKDALLNTDIFINAIFSGSGVKNKILQASMVGLPIISTSMGIEGINQEIENCIWIANSPEAIVKSILEINEIDDNILLNRIISQQNLLRKSNDNTHEFKELLNDLNIE